MRQIYMSGSMSGVWKRSHGRTSEAPPDERGGNSYARPTATAPHSDSTNPRPSRAHPGTGRFDPFETFMPAPVAGPVAQESRHSAPTLWHAGGPAPVSSSDNAFVSF